MIMVNDHSVIITHDGSLEEDGRPWAKLFISRFIRRDMKIYVQRSYAHTKDGIVPINPFHPVEGCVDYKVWDSAGNEAIYCGDVGYLQGEPVDTSHLRRYMTEIEGLIALIALKYIGNNEWDSIEISMETEA